MSRHDISGAHGLSLRKSLYCILNMDDKEKTLL